MATDDAKKTIDVLANDMPELGVKMQIFSLSMRSLYAENSVSSSVKNGSEFIELRDETRNDAVAYLKGVMPLTETCMLKLQQFIEYYELLSFEQWEKSVEDILEEVTAYHEACTALVKIHENILAVLKKRQDKAKLLCRNFADLEKKYNDKIAQLKRSAKIKYVFAVGLALVPVVNSWAFLIFASYENDTTQWIAEQDQQQIMLSAAKAVSDVMIPAMANFIDGLKIISGFFKIMQMDFESFGRMQEKKELHFNVLKAKSKEIKMGCRTFYGILPSVRSDFEAIPTEGTDFNYVDAWLEKQKKVIEENCLEEKSRNLMWKALKALKSEKPLNLRSTLPPSSLTE